MTITNKIAMGAALLLACGAAAAGGDPEAGKAKSETCAACHGETGNGDNPAYPKLAAQYASYLAQALRDYRSGARTNAIMAGFAAPLSDDDIENLAAFYASQPGDLQVPSAD